MNRRSLLAAVGICLSACSGPSEPECVEETRQMQDFSTNPKIGEWSDAGWDCDLLYTQLDPIFGLIVKRTWSCSRCVE